MTPLPSATPEPFDFAARWSRKWNDPRVFGAFKADWLARVRLDEMASRFGLKNEIAVISRARRYGLGAPPATVRYSHYAGKPVSSGKAARSCLLCGKDFLSEHIGNRHCPRCAVVVAKRQGGLD